MQFIILAMLNVLVGMLNIHLYLYLKSYKLDGRFQLYAAILCFTCAVLSIVLGVIAQ